MPKAEPIVANNDDQFPSPNENLVEHIRLKNINMLAVHGSNNGMAEKYANELCKDAETRQFKCLSVDSEELFADDLPRLSEFGNMFVVFLMSTYDGEPSTNSKKLFDWVQQDSNVTPGLKFAVFGIGDKSYGEKFNTVAKSFDERLEVLGGKKLTTLGLGDTSSNAPDDISDHTDYKEWRNVLWDEVKKVICPTGSMKCDPVNPGCNETSLIDRIHEKKATVLVIYGSGSKKAKIFSELLIINATNHRFSSISICASDLKLDDIPKLSEVENMVLVFCMPTKSTEEGTSSNAGNFLDWIKEGKSGFGDLKYTICALRSTEDEDMNEASKRINEKLENIGGSCVYDLGVCKENDSEDSSKVPEDFKKWNDGLWTAVKQLRA